MSNPFKELKDTLIIFYPNKKDDELNNITSELIDFFTILLEEDPTSSSADHEVNTLKNQ